MSEKTTTIDIPGVGQYLTRGHVSREEAVTDAAEFYLEQLREAARALLLLEADRDIHVYHQRGIYAARDRRELPRPQENDDDDI